VSPRAPLITVVSTNVIDGEQVLARVVVVEPGKEPRVLRTLFDDITHSQVILAAIKGLVRCSLSKSRPMRIVIPDRTVLELLQGELLAKSCQIRAQVDHIRHLVHVQKAPVTFERGTVRSTLGARADLIDIW
jgi:hypothetical protein